MAYLRFQPVAAGSDWSEGSVAVLSRRHGDVLGVISWYQPWREYVFEAKPDTVWSRGCLREVTAKVVEMTYRRERASVSSAVRAKSNAVSERVGSGV